jgi:lysozyme
VRGGDRIVLGAFGALLLALGLVAWRRSIVASAAGATLTDDLDALVSEARNLVLPAPVADMRPSESLLAMLQTSERLRLTPYRLGDGGSTIGWGRFYPDSGPPPPAAISRDTADQWFDDDVEARAARWVRAYVRVPLLQHQFDALVHMAFNLSPKAFRTIADAINAGQGPEAAALQFIRAGSNLEAGLRNRREREFALFNDGTYHA